MAREHYGAAVPEELIHRRVLSEIREVASDHSTVTRIARAFQDHGFAPADASLAPVPGDPNSWQRPGQRRGTFDEYAASVHWSDARHVRRVLTVFETLLDEAVDDPLDRTMAVLTRYGIERDERGRLRLASSRVFGELPLHVLDEPAAVLEQLDRLHRTAHEDPPAAISAAKALVEATCKRVLAQLGEPVDDTMGMQKLAKAAHKALAVDAASIAPDRPGSEIVVSILRSLAQIPIGLAELRNDYGPDHGRLAPTIGLQQRHADLAVGAAATYVRFLLDTLAARSKATQ